MLYDENAACLPPKGLDAVKVIAVLEPMISKKRSRRFTIALFFKFAEDSQQDEIIFIVD